jgi:hypothetical protein
MLSMKLVAIIAESIKIDVTEMKKIGLFLIRIPQTHFIEYVSRNAINILMYVFALHTKLAYNIFSSDFHTLSYNRYIEFFFKLLFGYLTLFEKSSENFQLIQLFT